MDLGEILESAGEDGHRPKSCTIPRRWLPGVIRWPIKLFVLPFVWLDFMGQFVAKQFIRPPFKRVGKCKKRGNCCHYILVRKIRFLPKWLDLFWHSQINGFYVRDKSLYYYNKKPVYLMGCRYLKGDGSCKHYKTRPSICRAWPRIEIFGRPQTLKGCGFKAQPRSKVGSAKLPIIDS